MHLTLNSGQMDHSTSDFLTFLGPVLELDPNPYPHKLNAMNVKFWGFVQRFSKFLQMYVTSLRSEREASRPYFSSSFRCSLVSNRAAKVGHFTCAGGHSAIAWVKSQGPARHFQFETLQFLGPKTSKNHISMNPTCSSSHPLDRIPLDFDRLTNKKRHSSALKNCFPSRDSPSLKPFFFPPSGSRVANLPQFLLNPGRGEDVQQLLLQREDGVLLDVAWGENHGKTWSIWVQNWIT